MYNQLKTFFNINKNHINNDNDLLNDFLNFKFENNHTLPIEVINKIILYKNKYHESILNILIHIPPYELSPAGYSIYTNISENLLHMGIKCCYLHFDDDINLVLEKFSPNVFLSSDDSNYINNINWTSISKYRLKNNLLIGLTASIEEYGNSSLSKRLDWAKFNNINFYYSWRSNEYLKTRESYKLFYDYGFNIFSIEFGANILKYYPCNLDTNKFIDYIFFGSINPQKKIRFKNYFSKISNNYNGIIYGPGWQWTKDDIPFDKQKLYYQTSKVGLNLHLDEQIIWPCELNERTYILGACKVPQLIDNPALLNKRYDTNNLYSANTPNDYNELFKYMLNNYEEVKFKTNNIYLETISKHTYFDRIDGFINNLINVYNNKF